MRVTDQLNPLIYFDYIRATRWPEFPRDRLVGAAAKQPIQHLPLAGRHAYEKRIAQRLGGQQELELVMLIPP